MRYECLVAKNKSVERSADYKEINVDETAFGVKMWKQNEEVFW